MEASGNRIRAQNRKDARDQEEQEGAEGNLGDVHHGATGPEGAGGCEGCPSFRSLTLAVRLLNRQGRTGKEPQPVCKDKHC